MPNLSSLPTHLCPQPTKTARTFLCIALAACSLFGQGVFAHRASAQDSTQNPAHEARKGRTIALLINGGGNKRSNYLSHFEHIQEMRSALIARGVAPQDITVLNADGEDDDPDMATRKAARNPRFFGLLSLTYVGRALRFPTEYESTAWPNVPMLPATRDTLRTWVDTQRAHLSPNDNVIIYVTDHGRRGKTDLDDGTIVLWNDTLSVRDLRYILNDLPSDVRVLTLMSQCFSGTFAATAFDPTTLERTSNTCGYFSTTRDRFAFGCYPEGRAQQRLGHAFTLIDALRTRDTLDEVQHQTTLRDSSPDVPNRSSDAFIQRVLQRTARSQNTTLHALTDTLLQPLWLDPSPQHTQAITLLNELARRYGLPSPRSVGDVDRWLSGFKRVINVHERNTKLWKDATTQLQNTNLQRFIQSNPTWKKRLSLNALRSITPEERTALRRDFMPAFGAFTQTQGDTYKTIYNLRQKASSNSQTIYRLKVREAILLRMRSTLLQLAGDALLDQNPSSPHLTTLNALKDCENLTLPSPPPDPSSPPKESPFPSLAADIQTLQDLRPSWLGVRYKPLSKQQRSSLPTHLPTGAVHIDHVEPKSPAARAGLRTGDILTQGDSQPFQNPNSIRQWVMTADPSLPHTLTVLRTKTPLTLPITLSPFPAPPLPLDLPPIIGSRLHPLPKLPPAFPTTPNTAPQTPTTRLLYLWDPSCISCFAYISALTQLHNLPTHSVLAVSHLTPEQHTQLFPTPPPIPFAHDPKRRLHNSFVAHSSPTFLLISPDNTLLKRHDGHLPDLVQWATLPQNTKP